MNFRFPKGFYWGSATSAHQVEGGNVNDWTKWEKENAERLAKEAEKKFGYLKNWPEIKEQAQNPQNYISGRACDHYNRYEEDFDIAKSLNHNAHRFSIEWSRIEPEIYSINSYLTGVWPPQKKNPIAYFLVIRNLVKAHRKIYLAIKKIQPDAQIGVAKNNVYFEAAGGIFDFILQKIIDWWWNFYFLNQIKNEQDFIGLNHYFHNRIKNFKFNQNENREVSDLGWELYPEGIYHVLKDLKKYGKPIYITENGLADAQDKNREWFIKETLKNISKAIQEGVDVRGYFYWSLLDNFEWDKGFWPRFGLVEIDYKTLKRKIRSSAYEYAEICKSNKVKI